MSRVRAHNARVRPRWKPAQGLLQPGTAACGLPCRARGARDPRLRSSPRDPALQRRRRGRGGPGTGRGAQGGDSSGRRAPRGDARVQLRRPGRVEECHRLGVAPSGQLRARGEARRDHGRHPGRHRHRTRYGNRSSSPGRRCCRGPRCWWPMPTRNSERTERSATRPRRSTSASCSCAWPGGPSACEAGSRRARRLLPRSCHPR